MDNIYTVASSSSSTTYGNVMSIFKDIITQNFSENYFKDIYLASELSYVNTRRRLGRNTLNEMKKLERPFMNINPQIQPPNGDMYLYDIPLTKNFDNMEYGIQKNTLFNILKNSTDGYSLLYKMNRDQIQFDISITVDTLIEQLDLYKYMVNYFVWERPFTKVASLEAMIPRKIVKQMGRISNIDIDDKKSNQIPNILKCLNRYSQYPITYKMRNGTALDEFFMYYNVELLINYTDLSVETVNRKGFTDDFYQITFRASVEFNLPAVFMLSGNKPKPKSLDAAIDVRDGNSHDLIPLYTINNFYSKYGELKNGFLLYTSSRFQTESDKKTKTDVYDLRVLFDQNYLDVIRRQLAYNIPINTLIDIILLKDGKELEKDKDWKISWNNLNMTVLNADDKATYCVVIYVNNNLFQENIVMNEELKRNDKSKI